MLNNVSGRKYVANKTNKQKPNGTHAMAGFISMQKSHYRTTYFPDQK